MKIGIIGSNGFIGKNLKNHLSKKKEFTVFTFSSYKKLKHNWSNKVTNEIIKKKPDLIINCSASQLLTEDKKSILNLLNSNVYSNIFFLNEAIKNKNFKGYITFGTKFEFDAKRNYKPLNFYAATKHANDLFLNYFSLKKKIVTISLKLFDTYGLNDQRKKILNLLLDSYKRNKVLSTTAGNQYLDYVHINEICQLINKISIDIKKKKLKGFKVFTVSSKKPIKLKTLIKKLKIILDKKLKVKVGALKYRETEPMTPVKNTINYPGWKSKYNLMREIKKIFDGKN